MSITSVTRPWMRSVGEDHEIEDIPAGNNGIGAFGIGLSNNVYH